MSNESGHSVPFEEIAKARGIKLLASANIGKPLAPTLEQLEADEWLITAAYGISWSESFDHCNVCKWTRKEGHNPNCWKGNAIALLKVRNNENKPG